jgi:endonuclease/exonuclease/phosphatase (EEP) superfamily protein YafD
VLHYLAVFFFVCFVPLLTLLPLLRNESWWVRGLEFPALQITCLTCAVLLAFPVVFGWQGAGNTAALGLLSGCTALQLSRVIRYTPLFPKQIQTARQLRPDDQISVLVVNVLTPNRTSQPLLDLIRARKPDIVLAVETDDWWQTQLDSMGPEYAFRVKQPLDNLYGMSLFSRLELIDSRIVSLVEQAVPSIHTGVVLPSGHRLELHCLHPAPPSPTENATSAERDGELLLVAKTLDPQAQSTVVMGDLNDVPWSATLQLFQKVSGLLDPRIGRGLYSTFHAGFPMLRWPLDHVFCSGDFTLVSLDRLGHIGSDHFPIQAVLQHTPRAQNLHREPRASDGDAELALVKIAKVGADEDALL